MALQKVPGPGLVYLLYNRNSILRIYYYLQYNNNKNHKYNKLTNRTYVLMLL